MRRMGTARGGRRALAVMLWAALSAAACKDGGEPWVPDLSEPSGRPADGLLNDPELQHVVDLQVRRSWEGLVALLEDPRPAVRARAAFALASVQRPEAVPGLVALLDDPSPDVRRDAAFALGQSAAHDAAEPLFDLLTREPEAAVRLVVLEALGKLGYDDVVERLLTLDAGGAEEAALLLALGRLGAVQGKHTTASRNVLLSRLDAELPEVRAAAAYFFGRSRETGSWAPRVGRVRTALDRYDPGEEATRHLVKALGLLKDPADVTRLLHFGAESPDWRIRAEAFIGLRQMPLSDPVRQALLVALDDPMGHVRLAAAETLALAEHLPSFLGRLREWIEANPDRWRTAAPLLRSLAVHDQHEFVLSWYDASAGKEPRVRASLMDALGQLRGEEAFRRLEEALSDPSLTVAAAAATALRQRWERERGDGRLHDAYRRVFASMVADGRARVVSVGASALAGGEFDGALTVGLLARTLQRTPGDSVRVARALVRALGATGHPDAESPLRRELTGHPRAEVREAAARALRQLTGVAPEVSEAGGPDAGEPPEQPWDPSVIDWAYLRAVGPHPRWILETEAGTMVAVLDTEEAPHTVQTVARLTEEGRFDGTPFHRVVPDFVIQGGDVSARDGSGGPGFSITTEITQIPYRRGVVGMASAGYDTEGSQFFITHAAQPHLDGGYTAFGWVVEGASVLDAIGRGDVLLRARLERGGS